MGNQLGRGVRIGLEIGEPGNPVLWRRVARVSGFGLRAVARRYPVVIRAFASLPPSRDHSLGQSAGRFDKGNFIEQGQGLKRRVRSAAFRVANFAIRRVEKQHRRRRGSPFPDGVGNFDDKDRRLFPPRSFADCRSDWSRSRHRQACRGYTLRPPIFSAISPLIASAWSRTSSPRSRKRGPRARRRLSGSRAYNSGDAVELWAIGPAHDEKLQHRLHVPGTGRFSVHRRKFRWRDKLNREPVQQLGMHRPIRLRTEILRSFHNARSKKTVPRRD